MAQTQLKLIMISHAATPAMRRGQFPADDALDERGIAAARDWPCRDGLPPDAVGFASPAACALATAHELGLRVAATPALAETAYGRWQGLRLADIAQHEPNALADWLHEPAMASHGGESFNDVLARVGAWMDSLELGKTFVAVTHASVMRAAVLHALDAPSASFRHIEIAPLAVVSLTRSARGWSWSPAQG